MEIFLFLMIKHALIDLGLQPFNIGQNKLQYFGRIAHLKHYAPHGVLTSVIMAFYSSIEVCILLGLLDYVLHWHTDYLKTHIRNYYGLIPKQRVYWLLNTADQICHFLGYYLIIILGTL